MLVGTIAHVKIISALIFLMIIFAYLSNQRVD